MRSRRPRGAEGGGRGPAREGPLRRDDVRPRGIPILAVSVVVVLAAVAHDVRFSPALEWLLASPTLAVPTIAPTQLFSPRHRTTGAPSGRTAVPWPPRPSSGSPDTILLPRSGRKPSPRSVRSSAIAARWGTPARPDAAGLVRANEAPAVRYRVSPRARSMSALARRA